ncbi:zf-HC2 domain-containing protein [Streptomyces griseoaurantiacus]|uniref:zf-HC2 domain-containing protein n=1 Tax=Streptomyces griseoaurantiacus TaxID=68213 RepID=UPI00352F4EA7
MSGTGRRGRGGGGPHGAHASSPFLAAYARGAADGLAEDEVWALEAHLEKCRDCRDRLSAEVTAGAPDVTALVGTVWSGLEERLAGTPVMPHRRRPSARLSRWTTPVMAPWLAMTVGVTLLALLLDLLGTGTGETPFVLLLAPVLPVLGVAASWSRGLDPAYELTASAPRAGLYLVLRRTTAVLAVVLPALLVCGWVTGVTAWQWLLPCLAFTSSALALGGVVGVTRAAVSLVAVWAAVIAAPTAAAGRTTAVLREGALPVWALVLVLATGVVLARRGAYAVLGAHR